MTSEPKEVEGFPGYLVGKDGTIYTARNGAARRPSFTQEGAVKVTLYRGGRAYTKSLARIVAQAWVYNDHDPDVFDTPIHLDNDLSNNHASNLAWRPRWFAVKYQKQYWNEEYRYSRTKVQDVRTGEVFGTMEVCQLYGLLFVDVLNSCTQEIPVFPTQKIFCFA